MAQNKPIKTPFAQMSFTPDIPSGALSLNEYNDGKNVETDLRGVKKVDGEISILSQISGTILFLTGSYRANNQFWFIAATLEGNWYGITSSGITDLTPNAAQYDGNSYTATTAFTADWNGTTVFINDSVNPPMWLSSTDTEIKLYDSAYGGTTYEWNFYAGAGWSDVSAGFVRVYSSPNVGSILVSGNLNYTLGGTAFNSPNTVRWSQAFPLNGVPSTWAPTEENTANELEVPVRGALIDGFSLQGNFYMMSYWDTVVMTPISYTSTQAPVFGIRKLVEGRGLLNEKAFCLADGVAYGLDARDIWVFNGSQFTSIANQRVKTYFYDNLNISYVDRIFMINNTAKNQIELYYPDLTSTGFCNKMLSYRYDIGIWNAPRDILNASAAVESPFWETTVAVNAIRKIVYAPVVDEASVSLIQKDVGTTDSASAAIEAVFQRDNIIFAEYNQKVSIHRVMPEVYGNGNVSIQIGGADSVGAAISYVPAVEMSPSTTKPWVQMNQNVYRTVSIKVSSNNELNDWLITGATWQLTPVEDDR
tara:strand:+ start:281 stop:1882 length:1602 start_codon:yes stop_codon:yes gene_type:complete